MLNIEDKLDNIEFVIFDLETTGLSPDLGDKIIEIGAVKVKDKKIIQQFHSLVNPKRPISDGAFCVNKISFDMVKEAPVVDKILPEFLSFIKDSCLLAYNVNFDLGFLRNELLRLKKTFPKDLPIIDILLMARNFSSCSSSFSLENVARTIEIPIRKNHRALEDARLASQVFIHFLNRLNNVGVKKFWQLHNLVGYNQEFCGEIKEKTISKIQQAINLNRALKLLYFSPFKFKVTERKVTPREIKTEFGKSTLLGFCHLRKEERNFNINGILHLQVI